MARQHPNVLGMRMFGAKVTPVDEGTRTLTDAVNAAMKGEKPSLRSCPNTPNR